MNFYDFQHNTASLQVDVLEFAVVTARQPDRQVDSAIAEVLRVIHDKMGMHFVFACELAADGSIDPARPLSDASQWYLFNPAFCREQVIPHWKGAVVPPPSGCFTVPVVLSGGAVVGVVYAPRYAADAGSEQQLLRQVELSSQLIARRIDERSRSKETVRGTGAPATVTSLLEPAPAENAQQPWALAA